jgi:hypothetical protein
MQHAPLAKRITFSRRLYFDDVCTKFSQYLGRKGASNELPKLDDAQAF